MSTTSNAHYQSKVRAEMRRALHSDEDEWGAGRPEEERITEYIYRTDTLIHYCVLEGMRMVPLLFYSLPEGTSCVRAPLLTLTNRSLTLAPFARSRPQ